ncbi:MAG: hypothetical protein JWN69_1903 [Alphaproteobacteria bacterium]|nr:hypothetical protein [Alphaproteobacteria bacterium]
MPTYRFRHTGKGGRARPFRALELPDLGSARREAKRLLAVEAAGASDDLARRIEIEQVGAGLVLVVPFHEPVWTD